MLKAFFVCVCRDRVCCRVRSPSDVLPAIVCTRAAKYCTLCDGRKPNWRSEFGIVSTLNLMIPN